MFGFGDFGLLELGAVLVIYLVGWRFSQYRLVMLCAMVASVFAPLGMLFMASSEEQTWTAALILASSALNVTYIWQHVPAVRFSFKRASKPVSSKVTEETKQLPH